METFEARKSAGESASDEELYSLCRKYGESALHYRRKFIGLLPEVYKRKLFEKKKFRTIFEFAAKLGGIREKHVRRVLNLERSFEELPVLKQMLVSGEVSVNKLAKIASIATVENELALVGQVKLLPCRALETLARDERSARCDAGAGVAVAAQDADGLQEPLFDAISVHVNTKEPRLDDDVKLQLADLQEKGIDINELLRGMLAKREVELAEKKELAGAEAKPTNSRYISVTVRKILKEAYGSKCSISGCMRGAEQIHHAQRFALAGAHDPRYMAPLCKEHHQIAHSIDLKVHGVRARAG